MSLPSVKILLQNGQLGGLPQFAEGVAALIGTGEAVVDGIGIGDPRMVNNLQDAIALGITEDDNPAAYRQVKEFYDEIGGTGELYIMLVPDTMSQTDMWDATNDNGIVKLLDYAQGRVRLPGSFFAPPASYEPVLTSGMDGDVHTALVNGQSLGVARALVHQPFRGVIEGRGFTGEAAALTTLRENSQNRMAVMAGSSLPDGSASVGLLLGRLARIPVQRKASRVKDGALPISAAYIGETAVESFSGSDLMHDKGYILLRTHIAKGGYFISSDPTAAPATDDYSMIARGRVIDKAAVLAYLTYLEELDDDVEYDEQGRLEIGVVKTLEANIETVIKSAMAGEISSVSAYIDPDQNGLATNKMKVALSLIPKGYNSEIEVELGFSNPAN